LRQLTPGDLVAFGLIRDLIGRLPVIASLDELGVDDLLGSLHSVKGSLIQQFRNLVRFHGADLVFSNVAVREAASIALDRGRGDRLDDVYDAVKQAQGKTGLASG
jgi:ATP-dependent Clp protease ATP-binding subunit ClpX